MSLKHALPFLRSRGLDVSRASIYRWHTDLIAAGQPGLLHQPTGFRGAVFVVPSEVQAYIRNRCSDSSPAREAAS